MDSTGIEQRQERVDLETLRSEVEAGKVDTVLLAMTDMHPAARTSSPPKRSRRPTPASARS
jgi:hypothetical protein